MTVDNFRNETFEFNLSFIVYDYSKTKEFNKAFKIANKAGVDKNPAIDLMKTSRGFFVGGNPYCIFVDSNCFKLKTKKERIPEYPVTKIQEGHYYWFTFTLKSPEYLQKVKDFKYQFTVPDTDKERRTSEFFASIEEMENKVITLPGKKLNPDEFLNFNFYISLMDCFDEKNIKVLCRFGEPPEGFKIDAKIYEIDLKDTDYKIVICVSRQRFRSNLGMDKARIYH